MTARSEYDCANLCNLNIDCALFTYNVEAQSNCLLYDDTVVLTEFCDGVDESTFVMYTKGRFTRRPGACIENEDTAEHYTFSLKSTPECAALCDEWFGCRSFRVDELTGLCSLYRSEQYSNTSCPVSGPPDGDLYIYCK